jgi:Zincin-like metallopeptidase
MTWHPYLPEPERADKMDSDDPEPVPLAVLRDTRDLCANFRVPPRQFRRRAPRGMVGWYRVESDIVAVDPFRAAQEGMGGEEGYYAFLVHELLHATGHPTRLARSTTGDYTDDANAREEATVRMAQRIVLTEVGFPQQRRSIGLCWTGRPRTWPTGRLRNTPQHGFWSEVGQSAQVKK